MLTSEELRMLIDALSDNGGQSKDKRKAHLQAKLSIMLEIAVREGR